jgi:hypothetical protein
VKQYRGPRWVNGDDRHSGVIARKFSCIPQGVNGSLTVTNDGIPVLVFVEPIIQMSDHSYVVALMASRAFNNVIGERPGM